MTDSTPTSILAIPDLLLERVSAAVSTLLPEGAAELRVAVDKSKVEFASDFQTPAALQLAKVLRQNPRAIAQQLVERLAADPDLPCEAPEVSGPGFIGFRLAEAFLAASMQRMLGSARLAAPEGDGSHIVIDYSSPNVAKRMHIGHIRSTVIGESLRRIGGFLGYRVIGDNHIGDWGTQFGQIIHAWRNWRDEDNWDADPVGELERLYVLFHQQAAEDESLHDQAREELRKLQADEGDNRALWTQFRDASRHAFDAVYERLGVHFDVTYGESHYNEALAPLVERLVEAGIAEESDGALCVFFRDEAGEDTMTPFLIQKKDGAHLYATTDLATIEFRRAEWRPSRMIYVTDMRQQLHFRQLFATARRMGVDTEMVHVWFGMMTLPEGAFSTRKGNVIRLDELLDEAERRARAVQAARSAASDDPFSEDELDELARVLGMGAVKYADLSNNPQSNVVFSFDKMLSLEGNTAPYLQYTSARTHSLQRRAEAQGLAAADGSTLALEHAIERDLLLHLLDFGRQVERAFEQGKPSVLATFLYGLATRYHSWYAHCPVLKANEPRLVASRLNLNLLCQRTLRQGLELLGIEAPERM